MDDAFAHNLNYEIMSAAFVLRGFWRLFEVPIYLLRQAKFAWQKEAYLIRSFQSALFNYRNRGLTIIYHIDSSGSPFLARLFQDIAELLFKVIIKKNEHIVVIAEYWRQYFLSRGYTNVHLIYCGFDLEKYQCSDEEVKAFRQKFGLGDEKILYIGNPQTKKGAGIAFEALKNSGYTLVTSGVGNEKLACRHLSLGFKDYLCLLKTSEAVVLMSQFAEGWNRIAHEAMLMATPVIGTGAGGMGEVLEGGKQILCKNPEDLPELVERARRDRSKFAEDGLKWARQFSVERFNREWQQLVENEMIKG